MRQWRGLGLVCSLALGCGGALPDQGIQEGEHLQLSTPTGGEHEAPGETWVEPELGTARLVRDIFPPSNRAPWSEPAPTNLVAFRGKLYFAANFEDRHGELWKSNGTSEGTVRIKRFSPASGGAFGESVDELTPLGPRLFFVATDEAHGSELWVSDGTTRGTHLVKDITPGPEDSGLYNVKAVGDSVLFFRFIAETATSPSRTELWRSDGTAAGTVLVQDMGPDSSLLFSQAILDDTLFFVFSDPAHGTELWKSDGTPAGTGLVKDIIPGPDSAYPFNLKVLGSSVFFTATDPIHGNELWRTDGTAAGTVLVADMTPGPDSRFIRILDRVGSCLYFSVSEPSDGSTLLYRLKDTVGGVQVRFVTTLPNPYTDPDSYTSIEISVAARGKLFFSLAVYGFGPAPRDTQLWVSDGTGPGTLLLHHPLSRSDEFGSTLYALDHRVLFSGADEASGLEPWLSDGTVEGTRLLQDVQPGGFSSYPQSFTRAGSWLFFVAYDSVHGNELWSLPLLQ